MSDDDGIFFITQNSINLDIFSFLKHDSLSLSKMVKEIYITNINFKKMQFFNKKRSILHYLQNQSLLRKQYSCIYVTFSLVKSC